MTDSDSFIRMAILNRKNSVITQSQYERGLTDPDEKVKAAFVTYQQFKPTSKQIETGLCDESNSIRTVFASLKDFTPSKEQIKRGLLDKSMNVRLAFAQRVDISLTKAQIERGLSDRYCDVRAAFAQRTDFTPTADQLERGLTDDWLIVRNAFYVRDDSHLSESQLERAFDVRFNVEEPTKIEDHDEGYVLEAPQCPYCKARFFGEVEFCEHVAFLYSSEWGIAAEDGATEEQIEWLGDATSRRKFDLLCRTFKMIKRELIEEGMACGPVKTSTTLAFYDGKADLLNN